MTNRKVYSHFSGAPLYWWALFVLTTSVYLTLLLLTLPRLQAFAPQLAIPDMMPGGYDAAHVARLFEHLGSEGRAYYLYRQLPLDMLYPALFAATYALLLRALLRRLRWQGALWRVVPWLPVAGGVMDYAENAVLIRQLLVYPEVSAAWVAAGSLASRIKSVAVVLSLLSVLLLLGVMVANRFRNKDSASI